MSINCSRCHKRDIASEAYSARGGGFECRACRVDSYWSRLKLIGVIYLGIWVLSMFV